MEEIKWDREAFAKQQRVAGPGPGFSLGGILLLFITVGVVAGGGYWYLKTRGMAPNLPEINLPSLGSLNPGGTNERLETMELRLEQIEKRLNSFRIKVFSGLLSNIIQNFSLLPGAPIGTFRI